MKIGMTYRMVEIMSIWEIRHLKKPHLHIYGRAKHAKFQTYQEAVKLPDILNGFYDKLKPLNKRNILEIKKLN